jgi:hypothetical protein
MEAPKILQIANSPPGGYAFRAEGRPIGRTRRIRSRSAPRPPFVCPPPGSPGSYLRDYGNFPASLNHSCELLGQGSKAERPALRSKNRSTIPVLQAERAYSDNARLCGCCALRPRQLASRVAWILQRPIDKNRKGIRPDCLICLIPGRNKRPFLCAVYRRLSEVSEFLNCLNFPYSSRRCDL